MHYLSARQFLDNELISSLSAAGKQLVIAAGIMNHIANQITSSKWSRSHYSIFASITNPAETSASVCAGVSSYYRSLAQILAIIKTMSSSATNPTPSSVKARLAMAVVSMSKSGLSFLESSNSNTTKYTTWLMVEWMHYLAVNREVFTGLAYFYYSKQLQEKEEIGNCIAFAQLAKVSFLDLLLLSFYHFVVFLGFFLFSKTHISEQSSSKFNFAFSGLPKISGNFSYLANIVNYLNSLITEHLNENDRTNRFVTFQVVPKSLAELPPLPTEAVIMNAVPYNEPQVEEKHLVLFILPEKKSFFSFFGSGSKPKPSETSGKSDSSGGEVGDDAKKEEGDEKKVGTGNEPVIAVPLIDSIHVSSAPPPQSSSQAIYAQQPHLHYQQPQQQPLIYPPQFPQQPQQQEQQFSNEINYPGNSNLYPTLNTIPPNYSQQPSSYYPAATPLPPATVSGGQVYQNSPYYPPSNSIPPPSSSAPPLVNPSGSSNYYYNSTNSNNK
jgi:hypothetical protein